MKQYKLLFIGSHVIQYYGPLFRMLGAHPRIDFRVLYCTRHGAETYLDHDLGVRLKWDLPLLEGYQYRFLRNFTPRDRGFFRHVNPGIVPALWRERPTAVWVSGWGTLSMWITYLACRVMRIPYFVYGDNTFVVERKGPVGWVRRLILKWLFRNAGGFLLQGIMNGDYFAHYGADRRKFFLVPYAVDNERFHRDSRMDPDERRRRREALGIDPDRVVLLFAGKLIERKNPVHLLEAVRRMRTRDKVAVMYMGDGRARPALEQYARDNGMEHVHFTGFVNQSEMPPYYALADVFVLPSSLDPRGTVTNEAMACELPVVISNMVGIYGEGDIVRDGDNGFIYQVGDNDRLAAILDELVEDSELRRRMGVRSWEIIRRWNFDRDVEGLQQALAFVSQRPPATPAISAESAARG
jgi:glycosyltransferase involved in cell wall biosynthesis